MRVNQSTSFGAAKLFLYVFIALIVTFTNTALAKVDVCQPEGMSDAEARRVIEIATQQGKRFRAAIDKRRADGASYNTDTTYTELMADPEQAIALAKERHEGRISSQLDFTPEHVTAMGAEVEGFLKRHVDYWVKKGNHNYFTVELFNHQKQLAVLLGGNQLNRPTGTNSIRIRSFSLLVISPKMQN